MLVLLSSPIISLIKNEGEEMHNDSSAEHHYSLIFSLTSRGPGSLSDFELLTLMFGGCVPLSEAQARAQKYTGEIGPAISFQSPDFNELTWLKGIGEAKAAALVAGVELGRRASRPRGQDDRSLTELGVIGKVDSSGLLN